MTETKIQGAGRTFDLYETKWNNSFVQLEAEIFRTLPDYVKYPFFKFCSREEMDNVLTCGFSRLNYETLTFGYGLYFYNDLKVALDKSNSHDYLLILNFRTKNKDRETTVLGGLVYSSNSHDWREQIQNFKTTNTPLLHESAFVEDEFLRNATDVSFIRGPVPENANKAIMNAEQKLIFQLCVKHDFVLAHAVKNGIRNIFKFE